MESTSTVTEVTVTEADLAEGLSDVLDRVRAGQRIKLKRDDTRVAVLYPPITKPDITQEESVARVGNLSLPGDDFAGDLDAIQASQRAMRPVKWSD